ncbi:hypothetical protein DRE_02296 [Drechslerella stenobrocha 248]|uniref:Large ribosomal subunit protein uL4m n=1 Tax=Drechslerella stenobrocha 248 TaxID=1043628 RepID=W7I7W2_9PEZI|nr:hypothetical protein DRE_02296 [Drechslerella stenobrocha 248]
MASCSSSSARLLCRSGASLRRKWSMVDGGTISNSYSRVASRRSMATEASTPVLESANESPIEALKEPSKESSSYIKVVETQAIALTTRAQLLLNPPPVVATLYKFPSLEPMKFHKYDAGFLHLPLRSDILHRAVVYEGNAHRLGRAKTKYRSEIVASGRKLRPQKGTGRARIGDASSPMLRGGAKAHGPKPRDFSIKLPRKMYDLAFRTALSYRYRKGELIIIGEAMHPQHSKTRYMRNIMLANKWGAGNGRTLFITVTHRNNLWCGLNMLEHHGRVMKVQDVDVKDLLEAGRIVIEQHALHYLGEKHGAKLPPRVNKRSQRDERKKAASEQAAAAASGEPVEGASASGAEATFPETVTAQIEATEQAVEDTPSGELLTEPSAASSEIEPQTASSSSIGTTPPPPPS